MKKLLCILVLLLCAAAGARAENSGNDLKQLKLKGKVKSIRETKYTALLKDSLEKGELRNSSLLFFNKKGNKAKMHEYAPDGTLMMKSAFSYKLNGRIRKSSSYYSNDTLYMLSVYKYRHGKKKEQRVYENYGRWVEKTIYKYDQEGNLTGEYKYTANGTLRYRSELKHDSNGRLIEEKRYKSNGDLDWRYTWRYDIRGNISGTQWYKADGNLYGKDTYRYDEHDNIVEWNNYNPDGTLNSKRSFQYQYDKDFNWTKRIEFKNHLPLFISFRQIEYF